MLRDEHCVKIPVSNPMAIIGKMGDVGHLKHEASVWALLGGARIAGFANAIVLNDKIEIANGKYECMDKTNNGDRAQAYMPTL